MERLRRTLCKPWISTQHMCICLFCLCVQMVLGSDEIVLLNPPEEAHPHSLLDVFYSCSRPATVQLDLIVFFDTGRIRAIRLNHWRCDPNNPTVKNVRLNLPDWLVYRADGIVPHSQWVLSCMLEAAVTYPHILSDSEELVAENDVAYLELIPYFERPVKTHELCVSWSMRMLQLTPHLLQKQCPQEQETVQLLSSIFASTGENFGITKTLKPYNNKALEFLRFKATTSPRCMFSMWILVTRQCRGRLCGLFHHVDVDNNHVSPSLSLTNSGQLYIQMSGVSDRATAFLSPFKVHLREWCQISVRVHVKRVMVSMVCINKEQRAEYSVEHMFAHHIKVDDTQGHFVIGGDKYIKSVEGFYGPVVYHRNRAIPQSRSEVVIPDVVRAVNLTGWMQRCEAFQQEMSVKISGYTHKAKQRGESDKCFDVYHEWMVKDKQLSEPQSELWEETLPHRRQAEKLVKILTSKHGGKGLSLASVGRALYSLSIQKLHKESRTQVVSTILPLLLQAGCLADNRALHMASVLYSTGLGVKKQTNKSWLLALLAAQKDDRLALLHLGHLHHQGLHGLPADPDLAYAYYANIALQTSVTRYPTPEQMVLGLDEIMLLNPPKEAQPNHLLFVFYSCKGPATVQLDLSVFYDTGSSDILRLNHWKCDPYDPKIKAVRLNLPDWLVYQADKPDSQWVQRCTLEAAVTYPLNDDNEEMVAAEDEAHLEPVDFYERPVKGHRVCNSWSTQMLRLTPGFLKKQCPFEQETIQMLSSIFASTGENYGITKKLDPHNNTVLENLRVKAISSPWCMFSMWIFVNRYCQQKFCGLFHHIDSRDEYVSPALFLTKSGTLHVQMTKRSEASTAFIPSFTVPLRQWCWISVMMLIRRVTISIVCIDKEKKTDDFVNYIFDHDIVFDDTDGYFVIGGGKFVMGVEGYYGPVVYHRNKAIPPVRSEVVLPDVIKAVNVSGWMQTCEAFRLEMSLKISGYTIRAKKKEEPDTSFDTFTKWLDQSRQPSEPQSELWEKTLPHRRQATKLMKILTSKHGGKGLSLASVGRALYSLSHYKLHKESRTQVVSTILPLLLQAGCLADNRALHMASVLYSTGLGVKKQTSKSWLLALLAAQKDDRLALLHLGHLHHQGLHGLPVDPDLAYAYYANIALQTAIDRLNPTTEQIPTTIVQTIFNPFTPLSPVKNTYVEAIYLNNDEVLNQQTGVDHHIFQWLKHQARRGATEAEQTIARMLFWGQQGVAPNIQEAVRHYERGAVQWEDPVSMYDYGIVLLQGHGVEKDVEKAIKFLKKAMDKDFVPAINAMAWYYEQYEKDYVKAVRMWEQADERDSPDAALNLGFVHSQGQYPGKPADKFMAYRYYLKAAQRGQIRGAVQLAEIWTTGIPGKVNRRPADALLWVKWAAEHNGYLGRVLRKALDSYLKSDTFVSLLYYLMASECGYAPAQFNVAYLCEQNSFSILDPALAASCMWRYYNQSIQSQDPEPYALIRMGDLLYEGKADIPRDLFSAAKMYSHAALRKDPQGWYNLGLLVAEGYKLPLCVLINLGLSELYLVDNITLQSTFYERCIDLEDEDGFLPCSIALYNVYFQTFQNDYGTAVKVSTTVAIVAASTILLIIPVALRRLVLSLN